VKQSVTSVFWPSSPSEIAKTAGQLRDYCKLGVELVWMRQLIFLAALGLAAFFYDTRLAATLLILIAIIEAIDYWIFRQVLACQDWNRRTIQKFLAMILASTIASSGIIVAYSIWIAIIQGPSTHFMSLFFLFAAALFAAMNNHQLIVALVTRLAIYGAAFLFIPVRDLIIVKPPLNDELWAQLFSSIFVLFFILECSRIYLQLYQSQQRQLAELKEESERSKIAYKAKNEFVSTMNHELRTPLTSIKGSVDLLCSGRLGEIPEQAKPVLSIAQRNSNTLLRLVNEILDLQSVEQNSMKFDRNKIKLGEVVDAAIRDMNSYAEKLQVKVVTVGTEQDISVFSDDKRLLQVLSNVLSNAFKFSPAGSTVTVKMEPDVDKVRILISDQGIGLAQEHHDKVFEPFVQLDSSDTRQIGGTGLGLNISKRIMDALGGKITYRPNASVGTTFAVELPLGT
jgi:signal transduction histidine kinase